MDSTVSPMTDISKSVTMTDSIFDYDYEYDYEQEHEHEHEQDYQIQSCE